LKLILIYGPPGVGKLSVAKELKQLTGFPVLHNHLVADLIWSIFNAYGAAHTKDLNSRIKMDVFEHASKTGLEGIISTFVYYHDVQAFAALRSWVSLMEKLKGEIFFFKIFCDIEEHEKRVSDPSRQKTKKLNELGKFRELMLKENLCATIPMDIAPSIEIDTTLLSPEEVAALITSHLNN